MTTTTIVEPSITPNIEPSIALSAKEMLAKLKAKRLNNGIATQPNNTIIKSGDGFIDALAFADLKATPIKITEPIEPIIPIEPKIQLNKEQSAAVELALSGRSFVFCGSAGTGKTTTTKEIVKALKQEHKERNIDKFTMSTAYLNAGNPSIVGTAFTRRAAKNMKNAINDFTITCVNIHKLVEFGPVYYELPTGKKTMRFEPKYNRVRKLPHIETIIFDESSMVSRELFQIVWDALPYPKETQFIFVGDIQQIPPVMGLSIFGPKLTELPGVELTHIYRQALESPIIRLATDIKDGIPIRRNDWAKYSDGDKLKFAAIPKGDWESSAYACTNLLKSLYEKKEYNPKLDMVLVPFNVKFGTEIFNHEIATMLDTESNSVVYEIIAGFQKAYHAVGDHILYNSDDYEIVSIESNISYRGVKPQLESNKLDRHGMMSRNIEKVLVSVSDIIDTAPMEEQDIDFGALDHNDMEGFANLQILKTDDDKFNVLSHKIKLRPLLDEEETKNNQSELETTTGEIIIDSVGEFAKLFLSYAITAHKAQGLQAKRVFFFLHKSNAIQSYRELIYTAITRAQVYLRIICDPETFSKGIANPRITGTTLEEKKQFFITKLNTPEQIAKQLSLTLNGK
jgi:DNA polymerase III delta prime subunit